MERSGKRDSLRWWALTGSGLILPGLLGGCGSTGHRDWWRVNNCATIPRGAIPPPYGTHTNAVLYNQAVRAEAEDFVIYKHEWYLGGRELGPAGRRHLATLGERLTREPFPVVVEPVEKEELSDQPKGAADDLNQARRQYLVDALLAIGIADADKRVVITYPTAEGLYGATAARSGSNTWEAKEASGPMEIFPAAVGSAAVGSVEGLAGSAESAAASGERRRGVSIMVRNCRWIGIVGLSVMMPVFGCATTRFATTELGVAPGPDAEPLAKAKGEMPPSRAAKLCLATAAMMEKMGYEADAIQQYEKARELDPRRADVAHRLAVLHDRQGDHSRANAEYKLALEAHPKDANLLNDMGYYRYERGDWVEAESWLRKALASNPKDQRAWINLGMTLAQQGKSKEALDAFAKAVGPAEAQANLGMILAQRGQNEEAKAALRESLTLDPDAKVPRAVLARLERPEVNPTPSPTPPRISAN